VASLITGTLVGKKFPVEGKFSPVRPESFPNLNLVSGFRFHYKNGNDDQTPDRFLRNIFLLRHPTPNLNGGEHRGR